MMWDGDRHQHNNLARTTGVAAFHPRRSSLLAPRYVAQTDFVAVLTTSVIASLFMDPLASFRLSQRACRLSVVKAILLALLS